MREQLASTSGNASCGVSTCTRLDLRAACARSTTLPASLRTCLESRLSSSTPVSFHLLNCISLERTHLTEPSPSAVLEDRTFFVSSAGWTDEPQAQVEIPIDVSFCPHAMTKPADAGCFVVPDAAKEWRFRENPLVQAERPIRFFASANINLPRVNYSNPDDAERLPIGSLCLVNPTPRAPLDDKEEQMLKRMANMVAKEIELGFQIERQKLYDTRLDFVSHLFQKLIVHPSRAMDTPAPGDALPCAIRGLSEKLSALTSSDFAFVLDIRDLTTAEQARQGAGLGRLSLLDCACPPSCANDEKAQAAWRARLCGEEGLQAVSRAITDWHEVC